MKTIALLLALLHPMGNFSINHHSRIHVSSSAISITTILDLAEIATFQFLLAAVYQKEGRLDDARAQLQLVSNIKKVYEANGIAMDAEIAQLMAKAGLQHTGS